MSIKKSICVISCCSMLALTGCSSGGVDMASITKDAVKDVAVDEVKSYAIETVFGGSSDSSLSKLIKSSKYSGVKSYNQKLSKRFGDKYYTEIYLYGRDAYVGDRRNNKPDNLNISLASSSTGITDFTIATYKKGSPNSNTFITFDMDNAVMIMGELKKGELTGDYIVYDAYYNTVTYKSGDKVKDTFENDNVQFNYNSYTGEISYVSDTCDFNGTPFKFTCTYKYDDDKTATYDFTTLLGVVVDCSDGTHGELLSPENAGISSVSDCLVDLGLQTFSKICVDAAKAGVPALDVIDSGIELATGDSLEDRLYDVLDNIKDNGISSVIDDLNEWADQKEQEKIDAQKQKDQEELDRKMQEAIDRGLISFGDMDDEDESSGVVYNSREELLDMNRDEVDDDAVDLLELPEGATRICFIVGADNLIDEIEFLDDYDDVISSISVDE